MKSRIRVLQDSLRDLRVRRLYAIAAVEIAICLMLVAYANIRPPSPPPSASILALSTTIRKPDPVLPHIQVLTTGLPVRLKVPRLSIDAPLDYVGMAASGEMESPTIPANAAWYNLGPRPGETGSAVVDGHYGWVHNLPAVFDNLHAIQKGDNVYIRDEQGVTITFVVRDFREYKPGEDATSIFRSSDGKAHLNLITCKGTWNQDQKSYSNRFVVFTDKV